MKENRKIIHIDMDAYYASVEQRDNPELRGIPLAIGWEGKRGVIATASYEARKFGIHSAMTSSKAIRKCPMLQFVRPNFDKYKMVSSQIHAIFHRYTDIIEPLSLDEAYLDVTFSNYGLPSATLIAQQIKNNIKNELNLIASAGVSYNKFLAKIASDMDKPDGLYVIPPDNGPEFIKQLKIEKFYGVGKVTAEKMKANSIYKGEDLLRYKKWELQQLFGKMGSFLYSIARGIDHREVQPERETKSIGVENTFVDFVKEEVEIIEEFTPIFESWWRRYRAHHKDGRTMTLKLRNQDFKTVTRSFTVDNYITDKEEVRQKLIDLIFETLNPEDSLRLIGVSISGFESENTIENFGRQLELW